MKTLNDKENPEWTEKDFEKAQPAEKVLPKVVAAYRRTRGKQKSPLKQMISLRLDPDVIAYFKSQGGGWQTKINEILSEYVHSHP